MSTGHKRRYTTAKGLSVQIVLNRLDPNQYQDQNGNPWGRTLAACGQAPDRNGEEEDDMDETWCCYDRQVIDDELYTLIAATS